MTTKWRFPYGLVHPDTTYSFEFFPRLRFPSLSPREMITKTVLRDLREKQDELDRKREYCLLVLAAYYEAFISRTRSPLLSCFWVDSSLRVSSDIDRAYTSIWDCVAVDWVSRACVNERWAVLWWEIVDLSEETVSRWRSRSCLHMRRSSGSPCRVS